MFMKERLHTIPVNEALESGDECPFCYLQRQAEKSALRYVAGPGASYMEPEVRAATDKTGFCPVHMKKLYDYGNTLGSALMLQTHYAGLLENFRQEMEHMEPPAKKPLFGKKKPPLEGEPLWQRLLRQSESCYICDKIDYNMERYYLTFLTLMKDQEFRQKVESSKGFCLRHFGELLRWAETQCPDGQRAWLHREVFRLMEENLVRVKEDLDWLIAKYDYRNASADWKNSRDALQRTMQKLEGLYPADAPYKNE